MSKTKIAIALLAALAALSLTACSTAKPAPSAGTPAPAAQTQKGDAIKQGLPAMKKAVVDLRRALSANDAANARTAADAVDEAWEKFEDDVKAQDKILYGSIETQLGVLKAGAKADKFDAAPLKKAAGDLDNSLYTVDPALAAEGIRTGATAMVQQIAGLKAALAKNDAAATQVAADKVDGEWYIFEHDVKAKDADLYGKVEEPLKAIKAGARVQPLDTKTLTDLASQLEALVAPLTK